jgi:DNA-binding beta-propeller fold protein YncE
MNHSKSVRTVLILIGLAFSAGNAVYAQAYSNPYAVAENWASLPDGRTMGAVSDIDMDPDGKHIWVVIRGDASNGDQKGYECLNSTLDPILKFNLEGEVVESFGAGLFIWPHGIEVDPQGNIWVTDSVVPKRIPTDDKRGHQAIKFSNTGEILMVLGVPGVAGCDETHLEQPSDLVVAPNGDIFVADGHGLKGNNRIVKFDSEGTFIKAWGKTGYAPGEFRMSHTIAMDKRGRIFVGDRFNNRIQLFDQEGNFITQWTQFGRPSGIFIDDKDQIYVADSESDNEQNPGWELGIRIGDAHSGWVKHFIKLPTGDPRVKRGNGAEFVAVDLDGNIYGGEPVPMKLTKYVRVLP